MTEFYPGMSLVRQDKWKAVESVCRAIIDHPRLLNDPVCVVATERENYRLKLEAEEKQETPWVERNGKSNGRRHR